MVCVALVILAMFCVLYRTRRREKVNVAVVAVHKKLSSIC
jgi:hypothetical protein